ncbi:Glycosyl transferase [Macleaya cordata]|uniref:Glycosyl transferase n=1 Tax=Macleaya cordata TaxID=56857 RepID=A0A200PLX3_MACCD|nr:Glycosyl transferase [Macleaya cordata]
MTTIFLKWVSVLSVGILFSAISLVVFGAFSNSFFQGGFSSKSEEFVFLKRTPLKGPGFPPIFAYLISGTTGENERILRLLKSVYHPRNRYLLNLDAGSLDYERRKLALSVQSEKAFQAFKNVDVIGRSYPVEKMGSSAVAAILHGAAILLKISTDWDWFITLSASDYPIMTQDDLLHAFTFLPRDLNFIHYNNNSSWKQQRNINQIVGDPNLYLQKNTPIFYSSETRVTPEAFKIFGGSPWMILTRDFMEYCAHGWDNLPRTLLMYFTNSVNPLESYFHTVLCNSDDFQNTTVNNNLRYILWSNNPQQKPDFLNLSHYKRILESGAAFAGRFQEEGNLVLQKLDEDILNRLPNGLVPGKWCLNTAVNRSIENSNSKLDYCSSWGNINTVKPGARGVKLGDVLSKLAAGEGLRSSQCN